MTSRPHRTRRQIIQGAAAAVGALFGLAAALRRRRRS